MESCKAGWTEGSPCYNQEAYRSADYGDFSNRKYTERGFKPDRGSAGI